jgi:hypothetical protein
MSPFGQRDLCSLECLFTTANYRARLIDLETVGRLSRYSNLIIGKRQASRVAEELFEFALGRAMS